MADVLQAVEQATGPGDIPPWLDAPEADGSVDDLAEAMPTGIVPTPDSIATAAAVGATLQPTPLGERWAEAVGALLDRGSIGALVRELAWQSQCVAVVEADDSGGSSVWRLRVEREMLRTPAHTDRLQAALSDWLQTPVRIDTEAGATTDTPALRSAAERERRQRAAEAAIAQDPLVVSLLAQYKTARIVPGSVQPC